MLLHFAYGSNMDRALMAANCPAAEAVGLVSLDGYRFIIAACGYASIQPRVGATVHGVLWRLTPPDEEALDRYESVAAGLYEKQMLSVRASAGVLPALTYIACARGEGRPKPGYMEMVLAAGRAWQLPERHMQELAGWAAGPAMDATP